MPRFATGGQYYESALKIVALGISKASKKWTMPIRDWNQAMSFFSLRFPEVIADLRL